MDADMNLEKARMKVATEIKRCELNRAMNEGAQADDLKNIAKEILSIAQNRFELKDLLDPVGYNEYMDRVAGKD